ncbi:MAG: 2Fe-2S iron-sulfur cluster binding domain-containing protein [Clostridia bacterium]|nr:2Fe-2S iron-sulfur cluster binding domain-containing protein [Clostridia bacterium]MBR5753496.1 2Fe-2S iron-sulfur cluster binding domain-containing protein [Clostridia bacterium]
MSFGVNVKGFLKDVKGVDRIVEARESKWANAPTTVNEANRRDPIRELADLLHPAAMRVRLVSVRDASPTAKTFRFVSEDGHIPVFQSGQYVNFRLKIGDSELTRPYSISSAPYEGRGEDGFFEITVRRNRPYLVPDWFFEQVSVGDVLDANLPFGSFYYEPLRDSKHVVALAGGSGIAPFCSLAKEVANGKLEKVELTILYGSVKADDIVLKDELEAVAAACDRVRVVHVLSDDPDWDGEKGFLTADLIKKYTPGPDDRGREATYLFCGPYLMWKAVKEALAELGVERRRFRCDVINNPADVTQLPGYPKGAEEKTYLIRVLRGIQEDVITAVGNEPVAVALERAGIKLDTHCRNGECGFCRSQLLSGDVFVSPVGDGRRLMDKEMGWFHPCSSWPLSDLTIKVPIL